MKQRFMIIDGTSLCYRGYYAIRALSNSKGEPTNAIYGFITMVHKILEDQKPDYLAICFDRREPTFRHERYDQYKAHRKPMPDDLAEQMEPIKEMCRAHRYAIFEMPGYEADDLIGTLAIKAEKETDLDVFIVTGDKDAMQLVNSRIKILNPHKENLVYDIAAVKKRFDGLGPEKVVDVMALMGDASDNIPGIPGVGEKTALKLIQEFGSVENLIKYVSKIKSKSQQALVREHEKSALMSKELAKIDTEVPVKYRWEDIRLGAPDAEKLAELFKRYEFRSLLKNLAPAETGSVAEERSYHTVANESAFEKFIKQLETKAEFSFDTETTSSDPLRADLVGLSFSWKGLEAFYVPVSSSKHAGPGLPLKKVLAALKPILENKDQKKFGQNIKYDWIVMKHHGIVLDGIDFDTMIASYLINPAKLNHNLDDISFEYLGVRKITTESLLGSGKSQIQMDQVPLEKISEYACEDADCVFRLVPILKEKLQEHKVEELFRDVEMPLSYVLGCMEMNGVSLDVKFLKELSENAGRDLDRLTQEIYEAAGEEFNINSTKQLADVLFVRLKLPVIKKTKTGFSTDVSVLEKLAQSHELPKKLLDYREKSKLKSTYLDALPSMINPETGLLHTSYHQTTTVTGRLSSSDPNLQNIPIRTEGGRLIRKGFIPRSAKEKRKIISADYSQIELRILGHLSGDKNLTLAFKEDRDIHKFTATLLYGVSEKDVTREMRDVAKVINFSIIYGKTAFGLSQDLGISVSEADGFITNYFNRYETVKEYLDSQKEKARKQGYLTTILGRRSYFPDINSKNGQIRQFAERAAINAPIQGSAADLIKLAMIAIQTKIEKDYPEDFMTMQVHDELVFDVLESELEAFQKLVKHEMENAYKMKVPLKVDVFVGDSWYKK